VFSAPVTAVAALAPSIGAGTAAASGGYPALFTVLAGAAVAGAALSAIAPSPAALGELAAGSGRDGRQARREPPDTIG